MGGGGGGGGGRGRGGGVGGGGGGQAQTWGRGWGYISDNRRGHEATHPRSAMWLVCYNVMQTLNCMSRPWKLSFSIKTNNSIRYIVPISISPQSSETRDRIIREEKKRKKKLTTSMDCFPSERSRRQNRQENRRILGNWKTG